MASRLPVPGGDNGNWGTILNDFLSQSLTATGTLNFNTVGAAQVQDATLPATKLDAATQAMLISISSKAPSANPTFTGVVTVPAPLNATDATTKSYVDTQLTTGMADSTTTTKGKLQLAGDLAGTAAAPTVAKVNGITLPGTAPTNGQVLTATSATAASWSTPAAGAGNATTAAPGVIQLAGDLAGTATAPTVPSAHGIRSATTSVDVSAATAPTIGQVLTATSGSAAVWSTPAAGAGDATTSTKGVIQLTGDLAGTATTPTVAKVNGVTVTGTPSSGQVITATTSTAATWMIPAAGFADPTTTKGDLIIHGTSTITRQAIGTDGQVLTADSTQTTGAKWATPTSAPVTSVAGKTGVVSLVEADVADLTTDLAARVQVGGDLAGTATAPYVAKLNGVTLPGTVPITGQVLTAANATTTTWTTPAAGVTLDTTTADIQPLGTAAAGSVGKAADAAHVHAMPRLDQVGAPTTAVGLNSQKITGLANGTSAQDAAAFGQIPIVSSTAVGGDLSGTVASATVAKLNGVAVTGTPNANQVLTASSSSAATWTAPASSGAQALATTTVKTGAYTAAAGDLIPADATSAAFTVTLPTTPADKTRLMVKKIDSSVNTVTVTAGGSDVFNKTSGSTNLSLSLQNQAISLQYASGTAIWYVVADDLPLSQLDVRYGSITTVQVKAWSNGQLYQLTSATRDVNEAITTASVLWPDGSTGTFTTDTASTTFPGAIDAYHVTYVPSSGPTKTITQLAVTRDAAGAITAQPALTVT